MYFLNILYFWTHWSLAPSRGELEAKQRSRTEDHQIRHEHRLGRPRSGTDTSKAKPPSRELWLFCPFPFPPLPSPPNPKTPRILVSRDPAGLASTAVDRTLNTWRNYLQARLLLTPMRLHWLWRIFGLNVVVQRTYCMGFDETIGWIEVSELCD
jgi:hypothetical protein